MYMSYKSEHIKKSDRATTCSRNSSLTSSCMN